MINTDDNFMNLCIQGKASYKDVDEYVEYWHKSNTNLELHEFLGLTFEEYGQFIKEDCFNRLVESRRLESAYDVSDVKELKTMVENSLSKLRKTPIKIISIDFSTSNKITFEFSEDT